MLIFRTSGKFQNTFSGGSLSPGLMGTANAAVLEVNVAEWTGAILAASVNSAGGRRDERSLILVMRVAI